MEQRLDSLLVSLKTIDQVLLETPHAVTEKPRAVKKVLDHDWLKNVELKVTLGAGESDSGLVTEDLAAKHSHALALSRVDLSRHDGRTGLVLGKAEFTKTAARSGTKETNVLSDLEERSCDGVELTVGLDDGIVSSESLELVGCGDEFVTGHLGDFGSNVLGETNKGVQTSTDGGTTLSKHAETRKGGLDTEDAVLELCNVSRELLSEGKRSGVLKMGTSNLDDLVEAGLLLGHGVLETAQSRKELLLNLEDGSNVHGGGESVVGRGRHVDVVVGVDWLLGTHGTTEDLNGAVGDDLVGVHVGLSARAGLPDDEGEVIEELERCDFGGGFLDCFADFGVWRESVSAMVFILGRSVGVCWRDVCGRVCAMGVCRREGGRVWECGGVEAWRRG